jgi:UDP-N-acetylmuramoyl-tripeptide--D-alanyl-D-alanine ligase
MIGVPHFGPDVMFGRHRLARGDTRHAVRRAQGRALRRPRLRARRAVQGRRRRHGRARWAAANPGLPLIPVNDTRLALGQLAAAWRARFSIPLLGITGSNGKTTVKEMCAAILRAHFGGAERAGDARQPQQRHRPAADPARAAWHASRGGDRDGHEPSRRDRLPDAPGGAHRGAGEQCPARASRRASARCRMWRWPRARSLPAWPPSGVAVFNADDPQADIWRELSRDCRQVGFGLDQAGRGAWQVRGHGLGGECSWKLPGERSNVALGVPGVHNARNACAAAAATLAAGASPAAVKQGLEAFRRGQGAPAASRGAQWRAGDRR